MISGGRRHVGTGGGHATLPIASRATPGPETNPWFWNPGLFGIELAPQRFRERLHELDRDLEACWNRETERWQIFCRAPRIDHPICRGWKLLFIVKGPAGEYVPLDERTFSKIYEISGDKWGNGKRYFDAVIREMDREKEAAEKWEQDDTATAAGEFFDYTAPKVGYGPISASKVVGQ